MYEPQRRWTARNKDTPRFKYMTQRMSAQTRGIPFLLTFEEWWVICCVEENAVEGLLGRPVSKQTRKRLSKAHTGKRMSDQARERMSKAKAGCTRIDWPDGTRTYVQQTNEQQDEHQNA
jgi:hypothetical protein